MDRRKVVSLTERRIKQIKAERLPPDERGYRAPSDAARRLMTVGELVHELGESLKVRRRGR